SIDAYVTCRARHTATVAVHRIARRVGARAAAVHLIERARGTARSVAAHLIGGARVAARAAVIVRALEIDAGAVARIRAGGAVVVAASARDDQTQQAKPGPHRTIVSQLQRQAHANARGEHGRRGESLREDMEVHGVDLDARERVDRDGTRSL